MAVAQLDLVVAIFGAPVSVAGGHGHGCVVKLGDGRAGVLDAAGRLELRDVAPEANSAGWTDRWEASASAGDILVLDVPADRRMRIELDATGYVGFEHCCVHAGRLWIAGDQRVTSLRLDALEALFAAKDRIVQIAMRTVYPLRDVAAAQPARVAWVLDSGEALVNIGSRQIRLPGTGLQKSTDIVLRDEIYPGTYAAAELPDGRRVQLEDPDALATREVRVVRSKVMAPREPAPVETIASTDPRLEELVAELARDPENDANRVVLVDLLQEMGSAFGKWVAEGGAVKQRKRRRDALGPLAPYLDDVEYRGGLPWTAKLVYRPPLEEEALAAAAADLRLGMLSKLRRGTGPPAVYARLVGSPRAIGLRGVDLATRAVAEALIARGHTALTHVFDVRFTKRDILAKLADPTFDGVVEIETVVQRQHLEGMLRRVRDDAFGLFQRPRCLVVREAHSHHVELLVALTQFPALPCAELQIGALRVSKRADGVHARLAPVAGASWYVRALVEGLPELVALEVSDEEGRRAAREGFPALVT